MFKNSWTMSIFYFYLVGFTSSISYSVLPFHFISISPSLFYSLSQAFIKHNRKTLVYLDINNVYNAYFRKLTNF